jgi:hypothetical protein
VAVQAGVTLESSLDVDLEIWVKFRDFTVAAPLKL